MLLEDFKKISTFFPPCHPGESEKVTANAELADDISPVFPYLNAKMKGTIYDTEAETLNFKLGGRGTTLYPQKIIVTNLEDREEAEEALNRLKELINKTYENRDQIEPSFKSRSKLTTLEIYENLPEEDCGKCGEPTCMAFATKLIGEQVSFEDCPILFDSQHREQREALFRLLEEAGYEVPNDQDH